MWVYRPVIMVTASPRGASTPSRWPTWLSMISAAAALVKPDSTGWPIRLTSRPRRRAPPTASITPTSAARMEAPVIHCWGSAPAKRDRASATMSAATATGPTARVRLVPNTA